MVSALAFFALGFGLGFWLPSATAAQVVGMVLLYPMIFLTGAAMPRELLPERVHQIARFLPLDPVVTLLRSAWAGHALAENGRVFLGVTAVLVAGIALSAARSILPAQE
jgi:ABC-2 type transport system permease protein